MWSPGDVCASLSVERDRRVGLVAGSAQERGVEDPISVRRKRRNERVLSAAVRLHGVHLWKAAIGCEPRRVYDSVRAGERRYLIGSGAAQICRIDEIRAGGIDLHDEAVL